MESLCTFMKDNRILWDKEGHWWEFWHVHPSYFREQEGQWALWWEAYLGTKKAIGGKLEQRRALVGGTLEDREGHWWEAWRAHTFLYPFSCQASSLSPGMSWSLSLALAQAMHPQGLWMMRCASSV
eukprot:1161929-Pelagomonas_calceolata.AAC.13